VRVEVDSGVGVPLKIVPVPSDKKGAWSLEMPAMGEGPWTVTATWTSGKTETRLRVEPVN
jgi:hypothetical protein